MDPASTESMNQSPSDPSPVFDPTTVPPYPVLSLIGTGGDTTVSVDGEQFTGDDAFAQALAYCAQRADELGGAVRARGTDEEGQEWPLVITADGELHELVRPDERAARPGTDRRRFLGGLALLGIVVVGGGGAAAGGVYAWRKTHEAPTAPPPPKYPGRGANLPVVPPSGYAAQADWAVVVAKQDATPALLPDDSLLLAAPDGAVVQVDALTGQQKWTGGSASDSTGVFGFLTNEGRKYLTLSSSSGMDAGDLSAPGAAPTHLDLGGTGNGTAITSGPDALFVLADQSVELLIDGDLKILDVPVPAVAAGARKGHAIGAHAGGMVSIDGTNTASTTPLQEAPEGGVVKAARLLGDSLLATVWDTGEGGLITTHDATSGAKVAEISVDRVPRAEDEPMRSHSGRTWVWAGALIQGGKLALLAEATDKAQEAADQRNDFTPRLVTDTALWGDLGNATARYLLDTGELIPQDDEAVIPAALSADQQTAYVVAEKLGDQILYALPTTA